MCNGNPEEIAKEVWEESRYGCEGGQQKIIEHLPLLESRDRETAGVRSR